MIVTKIKNLIIKLFLYYRKLKYSLYSNNSNVSGTFSSFQPVVLRGKGSINFNSNVKFGVTNSPMFYNTYAYIEARTDVSKVTFGNDVNINNSFSVISEKRITIGNHVLIGFNCHIIDSNFHDLNPKNREETDPNPQEVYISDNVFIGNNVTILKGVTIGANCVIASNSVVTKSFPENVVIGGNPAKIISEIN